MRKICAWCRKDMGTVWSELHSEYTITHGMCDGCRDMLFSERGKKLTSFLDKLAAPVVAIDDTGCVRTANRQGRILLKKELSDIDGYKGGDVFECAYAKLPEGCGQTIHCSGCTIRRTVMDTMQSGKNHLKTPACLNRGIPDAYGKIDLLITTEKVGEMVFLRIDEVCGN